MPRKNFQMPQTKMPAQGGLFYWYGAPGMIDSHFGEAKMFTPAGRRSAVCGASRLSNECRAKLSTNNK
jgi:hypothetical protein